MKKIIVVFVAALMLAGVLTSCNEQVCPAYVKGEPQQVENHG